MTINTLLAGALNGFFLGGLYATVAISLSLVFGVMRLVNVTHGEYLIAAAYLNIVITSALGIDPLISTFISIPILFVVGYALQRWVLNPVMNKGMEPALLMAFGLSIIAQNGLIRVFGGDSKTITTQFSQRGMEVFGITVPTIYVVSLFIGIILIGGLHLFINRSFLGKAIRAATQDPETAGVMGINVNVIYAITYAIGATLASFGGLLIGTAFSFVPSTGFYWLLKSFVVVVLGGMGSIVGTLAGGLILGTTEGIGAAFVGTGYRDMIGFLIFLLMLLVRPRGLFGQKGSE
ncbi:MAG: branched-chain amino acid ABC transporter permease [Chloroflexota bacterium]